MFRRHLAIVALCSLSALALFGTGCSDDSTAKPQVIFTGLISNGDSKNDCRDLGGLFDVGVFGNLNAVPPMASVPVADGAPALQGTAGVSCSVVPSGADEFAVNASVVVSNATGGLFRIDGKFKTTGDQTNVHVVANKNPGNNYEEVDRACIVRYTTSVQGVAAGRVWGTLTCPTAVNASDPSRACQIEAEFRFENCGQ